MNQFYRYAAAFFIGCLSFSSLSLANAQAAEEILQKKNANKESVAYRVVDKNIHKGERDNRQYQAIQLSNGMTVLLVSDSAATKSLAALALPVGSLDDPDSQQGLAHYLEHMVLMGSKKFPEPDSFSQFLSKHGGSHNASTASYRTAYYLEVEHDAFQGAMERLADAIAAPLLDVNYADRERNAVNAELTKARTSDGMRMAQVDSETLNPLHPTSRFSGGNLETLSDKPHSKLHDELKAFYQRFYSANLMVGVLYSNVSIDSLADIAVNTFGSISNRHAVVEPIKVAAATEKEKGIIIHYVPAQPSKQLRIDFRIENNIDQFRSKTDTYVGYLIGNRGENTLADWLQKQGLAESIGAGADPMSDRNGGIFVISATLTDKGLANRDLVIAAIFNYIELIKSQGVNRDYFDEISRVLALDFRYQSISRDMNYVENLSDTLLRLPVEHVLDGDYLADRYDATAITERLNEMTPQNARIWFISPDEPHDRQAYFVDAPYKVEKIAAARFQQWKQQESNVTLALPKLNPYIPDDFALAKQSTVISKPEWAINETNVRAMYMPSRYFNDEPKASVIVALRHKDASSDARTQVISSLTGYLANLALDRLQYQAAVGGVNFSTFNSNGLVFSADGFTQQLPKLLTSLIGDYQSFSPNEQELAQAKSWYLQRLDALEKVSAYELAMQPIGALSQVKYSERDERRKAVESVKLSDIIQYRAQLLEQSTPELLVIGNFTSQQVKEIATSVQQQLKTSGNNWWHGEEALIERANKANFTRIGSSSDSALAAVYIPLGYGDMQSRAYSQLLAQIVHPWFFKQLRTEEQLGYALFAYPASVGEQWGIGFLLQSSNKTPDYLYQRFLAFYQQADQQLAQMSDSDFKQYKQALINELNQKPQTLTEEAGRYTRDFGRSNYQFDARERLIKEVDAITKAQLLRFFRQSVLEQTGLAVLSQVKGQQKQPLDGGFAEPDGWQRYQTASELQKQFGVKARP
jgi:protease-3